MTHVPPVSVQRTVRRQLLGAGWALAVATWASPALSGSFEDFFAAVRRDDVSAIQRLEVLGFDLNTTDPKGQHALHLSIRDGALRVAGYLVARPLVDVDRRNLQDETPMMLALLKGNLDLAKALQTRGADVNKPGWAPLHYAATHSGKQAADQVEWLLDLHAYIDAESPNRTTPLMMAAQYGSEDVVGLLLLAGADANLRNDAGLNAHDFATRASRPKVAQAIAAHWGRQLPKGGW
jgi:ankyrin repeat protein